MASVIGGYAKATSVGVLVVNSANKGQKHRKIFFSDSNFQILLDAEELARLNVSIQLFMHRLLESTGFKGSG